MRNQISLTEKTAKYFNLWEPEDEIHVADRNSFLSLSIHRNPTSILNTYILMNCLFSVSYVTSNTIYLYKASSSVIRTKEKRYYNDPLHAPWFILWNDMLLLNTFSGTSSKANQMFYFSWIGGRVEFRGNKFIIVNRYFIGFKYFASCTIQLILAISFIHCYISLIR